MYIHGTHTHIQISGSSSVMLFGTLWWLPLWDTTPACLVNHLQPFLTPLQLCSQPWTRTIPYSGTFTQRPPRPWLLMSHGVLLRSWRLKCKPFICTDIYIYICLTVESHDNKWNAFLKMAVIYVWLLFTFNSHVVLFFFPLLILVWKITQMLFLLCTLEIKLKILKKICCGC